MITSFICTASTNVSGNALPLVSGNLSAKDPAKRAGTPNINIGNGAQIRASSEMKDDVRLKILEIQEE